MPYSVRDVLFEAQRRGADFNANLCKWGDWSREEFIAAIRGSKKAKASSAE